MYSAQFWQLLVGWQIFYLFTVLEKLKIGFQTVNTFHLGIQKWPLQHLIPKSICLDTKSCCKSFKNIWKKKENSTKFQTNTFAEGP